MQTESRINAYCQAVQSGQYERPCGLHGKYDNVRNKWEDEVTRAFLRPHLERLIRRRGNGHSQLGILDLGCGGGDGLETILAIKPLCCGVSETDVAVLASQSLARYVGVDINDDLLQQARARNGDDDRISFLQGDLSEGLPLEPAEAIFDLYFSSFGTFSHFDDTQTLYLLEDIVRHAPHGALLVCDWLGRYAYEWQSLWDRDTARDQWMDYRISYIYPEHERAGVDIDSLRLRLVCREEVHRLAQETKERTGARLEPLVVFDRSMLVGRHIDTAEYNPHASPLRQAVNALYEPGERSDLTALLYEPHTRDGFPELDRFQRELGQAWNGLVTHTVELCERFDAGCLDKDSVQAPETLPPAIRWLFDSMTEVVLGSRAIEFGDPRADLIEPQLAGALQALERNQQQGWGCGHGLVAIFEIKKN